MRLVTSSLLVAAAICVSAAAPLVPQVAAVQTPAPTQERIDLARRFVAKTVSPGKFMDAVRMQASMAMDCGCNDDPKDAAARDPEEMDKELNRFLAVIEPKVRARLPQLLEAYSQAYAREFSTDELKQMVSFAETQGGQHYLASRLEMEMDDGVQKQQQSFMLDLIPAMKEFEKEKCAAHTAKRIAAGDKNAKCPLATKDQTAAG